LLLGDPGAELRDQQLAPVLHVAELVEAADQEALHPEVPVLQQRIGGLLAGAHVPARLALRTHLLGDPEPQRSSCTSRSRARRCRRSAETALFSPGAWRAAAAPDPR